MAEALVQSLIISFVVDEVELNQVSLRVSSACPHCSILIYHPLSRYVQMLRWRIHL
jgi:hypothetical protein